MNCLKKLSVITFLSFVMSCSSWAVNENFLSNTAMSYFTKADWAIFNATQQKALNSPKADVRVKWSNPKSGSYGYMIPAAVTRENGLICRKVAFVNMAHLVKGEGVYKFCKVNNQWKIF